MTDPYTPTANSGQGDPQKAGRRHKRVVMILLYGLLAALPFLPSPYLVEQPGPVLNTLGEVETESGTEQILQFDESATVYPSAGTLNLLTVTISGNKVVSTGEVVPLSASAVAAALRRYGLHPEQLRRPSVAVQQVSLHPNHTWQMDASTCVLFYLDDQGAAEMPESVFYKNKLENFQKVAKQLNPTPLKTIALPQQN